MIIEKFEVATISGFRGDLKMRKKNNCIHFETIGDVELRTLNISILIDYLQDFLNNEKERETKESLEEISEKTKENGKIIGESLKSLSELIKE